MNADAKNEAASEVRLMRPRAAEHILRGLRCLIGGPERTGAGLGGTVRDDATEQQVKGFLTYAATMAMDMGRQVVGVVGDGAGNVEEIWRIGQVGGMCFWAGSAGRSAMLFTPSVKDWPESLRVTQACVAAALEDARAEGVMLVQAMLDPVDTPGVSLFGQSGLQSLATLVYMERRVPLVMPAVAWPAGVTLSHYEPTTHGAFAEAIWGSYEKTLDCPALSGMRGIEDVMAGHKAVGGPGNFDPGLWTLVLRDGRPVGCVLLAKIAQRQALDVAYLGLLPGARGAGLGRAMMQHVLAEGHRRRCSLVSLAVDELNVPALRLYRRFGFSNVQRRVAMIKNLGAQTADARG